MAVSPSRSLARESTCEQPHTGVSPTLGFPLAFPSVPETTQFESLQPESERTVRDDEDASGTASRTMVQRLSIGRRAAAPRGSARHVSSPGSSFRVLARGLAGVALLALAGLFTMLPDARADIPSHSGSEGQGTLPSVASGPGLALVGSTADVLAAVQQVRGEGELELLALDATQTAAVLTGRVQAQLDLIEMNERGLTAHLLLGDQLSAGVAEAGYGAWRSGLFTLPDFSIELPLTELYDLGQPTGSRLSLRALGPERMPFQLTVQQVGTQLVVRQR